MAQRLPDFAVTNFAGLVRDKSDFEMERNEFKNTLNFDLDEKGRLKRRRGSYQYGDTKAGKIFDDSYVYFDRDSGNQIVNHLVVSRESNGVLYRIEHTYLSNAITTATTTIDVPGNGAFAVSGTIEIEGDLIAYTGNNGTQFTGVTGIRVSHPANAPVSQWVSIGNTGLDTRSGVYFTVINDRLIINGRVGSATFDGTSIAAITDADEAGGIFAKTYRNRMYVAGSSVADGSGTRNGSGIRVSFSSAGDATAWDLNDFFDVEDDSGELITGLDVGRDILLIFKFNSIFTYDEVELKQRVYGAGAYNNKVIKKIDGLFYTFSPAGVHVTNGFSSKKISDPIDEYLMNFRPKYDSTSGRVVDNCFAGIYQKKYFLYIGNITDPEVLSDVVLVYDTVSKNWTVYSGFTNFTHFGSFFNFGTGGAASTTGLGVQSIEAFFAGSSDGKYYRLFEDTFYMVGSTTSRGGDIWPNLISDSAGSGVSTKALTKWFDIGNPSWMKQISYFRMLVETGEFNVVYRIDQGSKITEWTPLGEYKTTNQRKALKAKINQGYRIQFEITSNSVDHSCILNGFIAEEIEALSKKDYRYAG